MMAARPRRNAAAFAVAVGATMALIAGAPAATARTQGAPSAGSARFDWTNDTTSAVDQGTPFTAPGARPIVGNFTGDPLNDVADDILWYTPGPGGDALWTSTSKRSFTKQAISVSGTFTPIVGQFSDDHHADILWYAPGPAPDALWNFRDDGTIAKQDLHIDGRYLPVVGRFRGDGDDIVWYGRGSRPDSMWSFDGGHTTIPISIGGAYTPLVGQFGGWGGAGQDYQEDIFWYAPGPGSDSVWDFERNGAITKTTLSVGGTYTPIPGQFTDDTATDIIWYAPGSAQDHLWDFDGDTSSPTSTPLKIDGRYRPQAATLFADRAYLTDVLWFGPGGQPDAIWDFSAATAPSYADRSVSLAGDRTPVLGRFAPRAAEDVQGAYLANGADIIDLTS